MSEGVFIRQATVDDIEEMLPLRLAMQREFRKSGQAAASVADPEALLGANRSFCERKLPTREFVAEAKGQIVATSAISRSLYQAAGFHEDDDYIRMTIEERD